MVNSEELQENVNRYKDEVNQVFYFLTNIEKSKIKFWEGQKKLIEMMEKYCKKITKVKRLPKN